MKSLISSLMLLLAFVMSFTLVAQDRQMLVQDVDLVIYQDSITDRVIHDADIYVEHYRSDNKESGWIKLMMLSKNGTEYGVLETITFSKIGEKAFVTNQKEYDANRLELYKVSKEINELSYKIEANRRALTRYAYAIDQRENVEANQKLYKETESQSQKYAKRIDILRDILGDPEYPDYIVPVKANIVYANTHEKLVKITDCYRITDQGMSEILDLVMRRPNEDAELMFTVGKVGDFFEIKKQEGSTKK